MYDVGWMNSRPRGYRYADGLTRMWDIVSRQPLPKFIIGFDICIGEFDGDPAMWAAYSTFGDPDPPEADLLDADEDCWPLFRCQPTSSEHGSPP